MIKKGIIKAFDAGTYTATIGAAGSLSVWLENIRVSRDIPPSEMVVGRNCAIIFFDEANPSDAVVVAVYT